LEVQNQPYNDYGKYLVSRFGRRVQKISIDLGLSCLKNQGKRCAWCLPQSFVPGNINGIFDFKQQFLIAKERFEKRYVNPAFLIYFQAESSSASDLSALLLELEELYYTRQVDGFVFGIRPEDVNDHFLESIRYIQQFKRAQLQDPDDIEFRNIQPYISVELGVQSINQTSLDFANRDSSISFADSLIEDLQDLDIELASHIIFGLPHEGAGAMLRTIDWVNYHQLDSVKFHHLQIFKGTKFAKTYTECPSLFPNWSAQEYMEELALAICKLSPDIKIQRFINDSSNIDSKEIKVLHPNWEIKKNYHFAALMKNFMNKQELWQGKYYLKTNQNLFAEISQG
jgi:radical SAM protein (TIGR01212 family)